MANYTINNLPNTATKLNSADTLPIWDSANSKTAKISGSNLSNSILSNLVIISASSTTVTGLEIKNGSCVKIMFTSAITGSDTTTALTITYNGTSIPVKVGKQGNLSNFVASEISSGVYKYMQAYTTLELIYDGTQFIIVGNPVVLSSDSYTIYADGTNDIIYKNITSQISIYDSTITSNLSGIKVIRTGKVVNVILGGFSYSGTTSSQRMILKGFPLPLDSEYFHVTYGSITKILSIESNGQLRDSSDEIIGSGRLYGSMSYITID